MELLNIIYCLAELTEFAAFIALRIRAPDLVRPFRVPLPTWGCIIMLLPASILLLVILLLPVIQGDWQVTRLDDPTLSSGTTAALKPASDCLSKFNEETMMRWKRLPWRAQVLAWCGGAILLSTLSYPLLQVARERKWCKFVGSSPHEFKAQLRGQLPSARTSYSSLASATDEEVAAGGSPDRRANGDVERAPMLGDDVTLSPGAEAPGKDAKHDS